MTTTLAATRSIQTSLFVRINVPNYQILTFSDFDRSFTIDGDEYLPLGKLLGVTTSTNELKISPTTITISVSGIPNTSIAEIVDKKIKGSNVVVYRAVFDTSTYELLDLADANPLMRFQGIVNNYSLEEDWSMETTEPKNTISIVCSSNIELINNKVAGRKTNPSDEKKFYPTDRSMNRVPNLANSNFNFGSVVSSRVSR